ncbi:MAG: WbuC family cupin fold metalloprotein [Cyclonatronaceae bacterium]
MEQNNKLAFPNISGDVFYLNKHTIEQGITESIKSRRKRILLPLHRTQEANVQRLINFLQPGTYIRPHKHPGEQEIESLVIIKGAIQFIIFDDVGFVENFFILRSGTPESIIDIEPGVWHSFIVLEKDTIIYEAKNGPYNPATDKVFAEWSPEEYTSEATVWVQTMEKMND